MIVVPHHANIQVRYYIFTSCFPTISTMATFGKNWPLELFCTNFLLPAIYFDVEIIGIHIIKTLYTDTREIEGEALMLGRMEYGGVTMGDKKGNWSQCGTMRQHIFFKYAASFLVAKEGIANNSIWSSQIDKQTKFWAEAMPSGHVWQHVTVSRSQNVTFSPIVYFQWGTFHN